MFIHLNIHKPLYSLLPHSNNTVNMTAKMITVRKQFLSLHKTPIICDHQNCFHVFKEGEQAISKNGGQSKPRYFCLKCFDSLYI